MSFTSQEKSKRWPVLIVGAGPAGLGVAIALKAAGLEDVLVVDAREVGAAFEAWPKQMQFLTPSFNSNSFKTPDLNTIDPFTSPADFLKTQHPSGAEYARYLRAVAQHTKLNVKTGVKVEEVQRDERKDQFSVKTNHGRLRARFVVWAAGQFFYPASHEFPGAETCLHTSHIKDWKELGEAEYTVIGGYESGMDAAINLSELGKEVFLLSRGSPWKVDNPDPSRSLSPRTRDRLRALLSDTSPAKGELHFYANADVNRIEKMGNHWVIYDQDEIPFSSSTQPILATGFLGSLGLVAKLFEFKGPYPVFSESCDESTITPGLFYTGPDLRHRNSMFCFIYKFRSRFGVIAREIGRRLELPELDEKLRPWKEYGFINEDLACCASCECAIEGEDEPPMDVENFQQRTMAGAHTS